jgi:hypothetical protein
MTVTPVGHRAALTWVLRALPTLLNKPDPLAGWLLACVCTGMNRDPWSRTLCVHARLDLNAPLSLPLTLTSPVCMCGCLAV